MKIAILGASKYHLPLYKKAHEMGLETYCIAWAKGAFCKDYADHFYDISIIDKESIAILCQEEGVDGIISNALEEAVPTMAYVAEKCGFNGISCSAALRATNKLRMRECIKEQESCMQPHFNLVVDADFLCDYFPVIVKPIDGSCSRGVTKVLNQRDLRKAIERALALSQCNQVLVEEFIDGQEISVESISYENRHYVLAITDKETTGAPYFVETGHHQPSQLKLEIQERVKENVMRILDSLEITNGASHMEFKITDAGDIYFIEVGARGGGDFISYRLVELSTGYDYIKGMIEVALGQFTIPKLKKNNYSGVYFFCKETHSIRDYVQKNNLLPWIVEYDIESGGKLISPQKSQDRSGYVIYSANYKVNLAYEK